MKHYVSIQGQENIRKEFAKPEGLAFRVNCEVLKIFEETNFEVPEVDIYKKKYGIEDINYFHGFEKKVLAELIKKECICKEKLITNSEYYSNTYNNIYIEEERMKEIILEKINKVSIEEMTGMLGHIYILHNLKQEITKLVSDTLKKEKPILYRLAKIHIKLKKMFKP